MKDLLNKATALAGQAQTPFAAAAHAHGRLVPEEARTSIGGPAAELGVIDRWRARRHESGALLQTKQEVVETRENEVRQLAKESIVAQAQLLRAHMKLRFDTEFSALKEQGQAIFADAQDRFFGIVDAYCNKVLEDHADLVGDLDRRHRAGRLSDHDFEQELQRLQAQSAIKRSNIASLCEMNIATMKKTFNS